MLKRLTQLLAMFSTCSFLLGCVTSPPPVALQSDPLWSSTTLDNGFTYHLRHSENAPVSLRLIVHTGSLQETDQQLGYAHFLEHMAFNGTKHFKGNDIVELFEQAGSSFGADLNAYTGYHETVYKLDLANDDSIQQGLQWFGDISQHIELNADEIEKEKGVVIGEIRRSRPEHQPLAYKYYYHLMEGTQYQNKDPIGTKNSIQSLSPSELESYYKQWYQPSNTELVIYGNFDQESTKTLINQQFSSWINNQNAETLEIAKKRQQFNLTDLISTIEAGETPSYAMVFNRGDRAINTLAMQQQYWLDEMSHTIIRHRLSSRFMDAALPVQGLYSIDYLLAHQRLFFTEITFPADKREQNQALFQTTMAELREHGISEDEFEIIRAEWQTRLDNLDTDWNNLDAVAHADGKVTSLTLGQNAQEREQHRENLVMLIDGLSVKTINSHLNDILSSDFQLVAGVSKQEDKEQLSAKISQWRKKTSRSVDKPLTLIATNAAFNTPKLVGSVVSQQPLLPVEGQGKEKGLGYNIHTWTLSNGINVLYQRDPKVGSKVHMVLASRGGKTALDSSLHVASEVAINTVSRSGIGEFDGSSLDAHLRRYDLTLYPFINFTHHGVELKSNQKHLPDSFAALHTIFTDIKVDEEQLAAVKQELHQYASSFLSSPVGQFSKQLNHVSYQPSSPHWFQEISTIDSITKQQIEHIHTELFTKNRNYQLVIIGDVDASELTPLLRKYIASIPLTHADDQTFPIAFKKYKSERVDVSANTENSSHYLLRITNPKTKPIDAKSVFIDDLLQRMLNQRLTKHVREELSLDYAPNAFSVIQDSELASDWMLTADTEPEDVEQVEQAIDHVLQDILTNISQQELASTGSQLVNDLTPLDNDATQRAWFYTRYLIHDYSLDALFDPQQQVNMISLSDVQMRASTVFGEDTMVVKGVLRPKP